jgi:hypothetical protein
MGRKGGGELRLDGFAPKDNANGPA